MYLIGGRSGFLIGTLTRGALALVRDARCLEHLKKTLLLLMNSSTFQSCHNLVFGYNIRTSY